MSLEGKTFKHLTVISSLGKDKNRHEVFLCQCKCGKKISVVKNNLMSGNSGSCGCMKAFKHGQAKNRKHTKVYSAYHDMKNRCYNPKLKNYKIYGGRGIKVCDTWLGKDGFLTFLQDMGECPDGYSLERIDVNKGYSKENCKWIPFHEQQYNKRRSVKITINDVTMTESEWSKVSGIPKSTLRKRRLKNWPPEILLIPPIQRHERKFLNELKLKGN